MHLDPPPLLYILQCLEQEGVVRPNLSSCGNKICIYGHTEDRAKKVNEEKL